MDGSQSTEDTKVTPCSLHIFLHCQRFFLILLGISAVWSIETSVTCCFMLFCSLQWLESREELCNNIVLYLHSYMSYLSLIVIVLLKKYSPIQISSVKFNVTMGSESSVSILLIFLNILNCVTKRMCLQLNYLQHVWNVFCLVFQEFISTVETLFPYITLVLTQQTWPPLIPASVTGLSQRVALHLNTASLPKQEVSESLMGMMDRYDLIVQDTEESSAATSVSKQLAGQPRGTANTHLYVLSGQS